jgi:predicted PurR-regulated permease PerM
VPNRYFEVALTVLDNVDQAIGNYLRGTFLECLLVGLTFIACLALIGVQVKWAVIIGLISGFTTAIPFLGTAIGLVTGAAYALLAEEVHSVLPFMTADNLILGIAATVAVAHLLDNAVFQPYVLGGAVNLHPLMVILGITGGSLLFGFSGMLFAIPVIVVCRVILETIFRELKAYYLI